MANEKHLYLTMRGGFTGAGMDRESWQYGVRLALVVGQIDPAGVLPNNWNVSPFEVVRTGAQGTVESNFLVDGPLGNDFDPADYLENEVAQAAAQFHQSGTRIHSSVVLKELRISPVIAPEGKVVETAFGKAKATLTYTTPQSGNGTGGMLPPQSTVVVSLRTPRSGARGRGRIFLPPYTTAQVEAATGALDPAKRNALAAAAATFINALTYSGGAQGVNVAPIVTGKPFVNYAKVTSVGVGSRIDTQRRRRNRLVETYTDEVL